MAHARPKKKAAKKSSKATKGTRRTIKKKAKKKASRAEPGYKRNSIGGIYIPEHLAQASGVVPGSALEKGISEAKRRMKSLVAEIADTMGDDYDLSEVKFEASFNADGKFLGFGVGGATTITITVRPTSD